MCYIPFIVINIWLQENLRDCIPIEWYYNEKRNMCKYITNKKY